MAQQRERTSKRLRGKVFRPPRTLGEGMCAYR